MMKVVHVDRVSGVGRESDDIRLCTHLDAPFGAKSHEIGGTCRHPPDDRLERNAPQPRLGPHGAQTDLQPRDATPGQLEITVVPELERGRRWRMVGDDDIDHPVDEPLP